MRTLSATLLALLLAAPASAQELSGDRPDFTDGPDTVATGAFQVEGGAVYILDGGVVAAPGLMVRTGLGDSMELRISPPSAIFIDGETFMGDVGLGIKYSTEIGEGFQVGVVPAFSAPVKGEDRDAGGAGATIAALWALDLGGGLGVGGNVGTDISGIAAPGLTEYEGDADLTHFVTLSGGYGLSDQMSLFAEGYAILGEDTELYADAGLLYLLTPNVQIDVSAGLPLSQTDAAWVGVGVVLLVGGSDGDAGAEG